MFLNSSFGVKPLIIKNEEGRSLYIIHDFDDFDPSDLGFYYGNHVKRAIVTGEFEKWLLEQNQDKLVSHLKNFGSNVYDYLNSIYFWLKQPEYKNFSFKDIAGYESHKNILINESKTWLGSSFLPKHFSPESILLYGPPGTGKTRLALATGGENNSICLYGSGASINKSEMVSSLFRVARNFKPSTLIIDEIDGLVKPRESGLNSDLASALISELDGLENNNNLLTIGVTNFPWNIDNALLRSGRFSKRIYVGTPKEIDRKKIIEAYLKGIKYSKSIVSFLVKSTEFFSCADLKQLVATMIREAYRDQQKKELIITQKYAKQALELMKPTTLLWFEKLKSTDPPKEAEHYFPEMIKELKEYEKKDLKGLTGLIS